MNQLPLNDNQANVDVFWVGLSAVRVDEVEKNVPLDPSTKSGSLMKEIEQYSLSSLRFYRTNIVKCLPLVGNKIRYPSKREMRECFPNLLMEIQTLQPQLVFLLGKQVSDFVTSALDIQVSDTSSTFNYESYYKDGVTYIPVHHPSYILVYKRKFIEDYKIGISRFFFSLSGKSSAA